MLYLWNRKDIFMSFEKMKRDLENTQEIKEIDNFTIDTDLFGESKMINIENLDEELKKRGERYVRNIDINLLKENPNNHFSKLDGEKWEDFISSIKTNGIINPILARSVEDGFEIIAGHNRVRAGKETGLKEVPVIITDVDDIEASVLIGITNIQRENVTDLEIGWAYRTTYEALKVPRKDNLNSPKCQSDTSEKKVEKSKKRTDEIVAEKFGVGSRTVNRKIRLTYLIDELYSLYENKKLSQEIVIELSYLNTFCQVLVIEAIRNKQKLNVELAKEFRKANSVEKIKELLSSNKVKVDIKATGKKEKVKSYKISDEFFPENLKPKEKEEYILKSLKYIKDNKIKV